MEERRGKMDRKKFGAVLVALLTGVVLSAGSASAQFGYLMGDPATGKLIPFYRVGVNTSTIIGVTSTEGGALGPNVGEGDLGSTSLSLVGGASRYSISTCVCRRPTLALSFCNRLRRLPSRMQN